MSENTQVTQSSNAKFLWLGLVVIVILIAGGLWVGGDSPSSQRAPVEANTGAEGDLVPAPLAGHPAPDFTLKNLEGEIVTLSDFRGRPVIVNFWATWCGPCRVEMPHLQAAYENNDDLVVLGVNLTERDSVEEVPAFLNEFGLTFPIVLDENGDVAMTYQIIGQPASVFINEDGVIYEVFRGPVNEQYINERVAELNQL